MPIELIPPEAIAERKKAEGVPIEEKIPKVPSPKARKESRILIPKKEYIGVPVIPMDNPCCAKLCQALNDNIDAQKRLIGEEEGKELYKSKAYRQILYQRDALENHRQDLKDKNICRCIESTGAVTIMLPLQQAKFATERITPSKGAILKIPPPERIRAFYRGDKPKIPTENSCCTESCKSLNNEISEMDKILDNMELRGGPPAYKNPRYEIYSYMAYALKSYRDELRRKNICKCSE